MKCVICKLGETTLGKATVMLERDQTTLVIKGVPAQVCQSCGETYVDEAATAALLRDAEEAAQKAVQFEVRIFAA